MMRILLAITIFATCFCSCNKQEQPLTKEQIKQTVDSIFAARTRDADERSRIDLHRRIKIEVKVKADSIYNAMLSKHSDTAKHVAAVPVAAIPAMK